MTRPGKATIRQRLLFTVGLFLIAICPSCEVFAAAVFEALDDDDNVHCETFYEPSEIPGHIWAYSGKR